MYDRLGNLEGDTDQLELDVEGENGFLLIVLNTSKTSCIRDLYRSQNIDHAVLLLFYFKVSY